jgi:hypothetical protein
MNYLPLSECVKGRVYDIHSRNLSIGVFDGDRGFIGIRQKFNSRYLFTEYHWDSPPFATVKPLKYLELDVPNGMLVAEHMSDDTFDSITNRIVKFDKPISEGGRGWYFVDTNEASVAIRPVSAPDNKELFEFLDEIQRKHLNDKDD